MVLDSFQTDDHTVNICMSLVDLNGDRLYAVTIFYAGDGMPQLPEIRREVLHGIHPIAQLRTQKQLVSFVRYAVKSEEWRSTLLLTRMDFDFEYIEEPEDPMAGGALAFKRGLPSSANPYKDVTIEFDEWDQGWTQASNQSSEKIPS